MEPERQFMGRKKAKLWTYLIFGTVLVLGVLLANFTLVEPDLTRRSVDYFLGLPSWAFPVIAGVFGRDIENVVIVCGTRAFAERR